MSINLNIEGENYLFNLSNRVLSVDKMLDDKANLTLEISKKDLVHLFLVKDYSVKESQVKVKKGDLAKLQRLVDLTDSFSPFYLHVR